MSSCQTHRGASGGASSRPSCYVSNHLSSDLNRLDRCQPLIHERSSYVSLRCLSSVHELRGPQLRDRDLR